MQNNSIKKIIAGVAAVAATTIGLGMAAPAATAADLGNIDPSAKGTLTIEKHKQTGANGTKQGDGTQQDVGGDVLQGVTFKVYKTTADMTDPKTWDNLNDLSLSGSNVLANGSKIGTVDLTSPAYEQATNKNGQIVLTDVPLGLYYVVEGDYSGTGKITQKVQPFFVSMPYPNAKQGWNYNVYVYPKNGFGTTVKHVDEDSVKKALKVGDKVSWNIDQDVTYTSGNKITAFGIVDQLDSNVSFDKDDANSVVVSALDDKGNKLNPDVVFTKGADYTVSPTSKTVDGKTVNYVEVAFTETGLGKLKNYSKIRFTLTTTVSKNLADPTVPNAVYPILNEYNPFHSDTPGTPIPSEDQPYYGDFAFQKVDDQTPAKALNGATFRLWRKSVAGCDVTTVPSDALTAVSGTSDSLGNDVSVAGKVVFKGVLIGKGNKGLTEQSDLDNIKNNFCLRETQAPAGFVTPAISATQTVELHAGRNATSPESINTHDPITNTKEQGPNLPLTGAAGRLILILGSVAVLAAAAALFVVNQRRQRANR